MRRLVSFVAGTFTASLLTACTPGSVLGLVQPSAAGGEARDIAYAPGPRHTMDLYLPAAGEKRPPVVVFFYGGGWKSGDRASYRFVGRNLAACGAMTFIPDYRLWPETGYRGILSDGARAVAFARQEAERHGGDIGRLFLMGHSAGGYIAAMLTLDPEWLRGEGVDPRSALAGMVGLAGPYDFLPLRDPELEQIFAPVGPSTQPITFAAHAKAPLLLLTGADDTTVYPANSTRLAERVREAGGQAQVTIYPGIGHIGLVGSLAAPLRFLTPVRDDACRFLGGTRPMARAAE